MVRGVFGSYMNGGDKNIRFILVMLLWVNDFVIISISW